jgi:hypothetical protein
MDSKTQSKDSLSDWENVESASVLLFKVVDATLRQIDPDLNMTYHASGKLLRTDELADMVLLYTLGTQACGCGNFHTCDEKCYQKFAEIQERCRKRGYKVPTEFFCNWKQQGVCPACWEATERRTEKNLERAHRKKMLAAGYRSDGDGGYERYSDNEYDNDIYQ